MTSNEISNSIVAGGAQRGQIFLISLIYSNAYLDFPKYYRSSELKCSREFFFFLKINKTGGDLINMYEEKTSEKE